MTREYDVAVVGAGVTGVAVAKSLAHQRPQLRVVLLDKEHEVAAHTSGRNSGVAHGGYNPAPGTKKARFCVEGNRRLRGFCHERGIKIRQTGVLVVSQNEQEEATLQTLLARGRANGVEGIELLGARRLTELEPAAIGTAALHAPTVAAVDSKAVVQALAGDARELGVQIVYGADVTALDARGHGYRVLFGDDHIDARFVVNCAGLHADELAHSVGVGLDYSIVPFRGEYYEVRPERRGIVTKMVYPTPNLEFPFLGIHFTPNAHDELLLGPNVVLALGREAYGRFEIEPAEAARLLVNSPFRKIFSHYPEFRGFALRFLRTSLSRQAFLDEASKLVRGLTLDDLVQGHPPGIRAQLVRRDGHLVEDLMIEWAPNALHVLNVVSPGFTCAMPFADDLATQVLERL